MIPSINIIKEHISTKNNYIFDKSFLNKEQIPVFSRPIGLYDPLGENLNPLTMRPYENLYKSELMSFSEGPLDDGHKYAKTYAGMAYSWANFVIYKKLDEIIHSIKTNQVTLIKAGTGVGKTVITPKAALQAFNFQKKVICAIPKRSVTKTAADYSAACLDVHLGHEVGYRYKGDNKSSNNTKLLYTTTGTIKSIITGIDPYLSEYNCLIIDEAHERSVQIDQLLYFAKKILAKRPDFRIIIMSATIDTSLFRRYFTGFSYADFDFPGKTFPVEIVYTKRPVSDWKTAAVECLHHILDTTTTGDILIFTKSGGEGRVFCEGLKALYTPKKNHGDIDDVGDVVVSNHDDNDNYNSPLEIPYCAVLESRSSKTENDLAVKEFQYLQLDTGIPGTVYSRKVVTATNIAESSITIDGLAYVIDCGYALEASYFPAENASSLLEERISQAACVQRAGRVGRTKKGTCYRLYTEQEFKQFRPYPIPDMQKTDLVSDILDICTMPGINDNSIKETDLTRGKRVLAELISPPEPIFIETAIDRLYKIAAISGGNITPLGHGISLFRTIEPEFATAMLAGYYYNCKMDVINIIVILHEIEFRMEKLYQKFSKKTDAKAIQEKAEMQRKQRRFNHPLGDHMTCLNIYMALKRAVALSPTMQPRDWCKDNGINAHIFIAKGAAWDKIKAESLRYSALIETIVRPIELKIKYHAAYLADGGKYSLKELEKQLAVRNGDIYDGDDDGDDALPQIKSVEIMPDNRDQEGGASPTTRKFKPSPVYELNFFPDAVDLGSRDNNIMKAIMLGCSYNIARQKEKNIYKTIHPFAPRTGIPDMNSRYFLQAENSHDDNYILYGQLFMSNKTAKNLKFNIVSSITRLYNKSDLEINENYKISKKLANDTKYIIDKNSPKKSAKNNGNVKKSAKNNGNAKKSAKNNGNVKKSAKNNGNAKKSAKNNGNVKILLKGKLK